MSHPSRRDDLAAYALGSLEAEEAAELESHLDGCESCRDELAWLSPAIQVLAESAPPRSPPPQLRERLMEEVREEVRASTETAARPPPPRLPFAARMRSFVLRPAVALTVMAVLVAGVAGFVVGGDGGEGTTTIEAVNPSVTAKLEREGDSGTLELAGLEQLPRSKTYQAWIQHGTRVQPSSLLAESKDGTASAPIPGNLEGADAMLVTVEPRAGSEQPTTAPVVEFDI